MKNLKTIVVFSITAAFLLSCQKSNLKNAVTSSTQNQNNQTISEQDKLTSNNTAASTGTLPAPAHIVVVIFENHAFQQIIGSTSAPYINSLANAAKSASFTQSYGIEHPSQPNYLDLYSGSNQGVTNDNLPSSLPFTTPNLGSQLISAAKSFSTFSEGLPSVGYNGVTSGYYARKHNPAANWMGSGTNQIPASTNQPFTAFPTNYANLPTVSFVIPNLHDDMHSASISAGDTWLHTHLDSYIQWAKTNNSLFILTFDEDDDHHSNHITTIFSGQNVKKGLVSTTINHYSILRTIEDMYGLPHAGNAVTASAITSCWQ